MGFWSGFLKVGFVENYGLNVVTFFHGQNENDEYFKVDVFQGYFVIAEAEIRMYSEVTISICGHL